MMMLLAIKPVIPYSFLYPDQLIGSVPDDFNWNTLYRGTVSADSAVPWSFPKSGMLQG
jgi:hypothetical protein